MLAEAEIRAADLHVASARVNAAMMLSSVSFDTTTVSPDSKLGGGAFDVDGCCRDGVGWRDRDRERRVDGMAFRTSIQAEPCCSTTSCAATSSM